MQQTSAFGAARTIVREQGLGFDGLSKGLTATLGRHGVWNMIYFAFYHNMKGWLPEAEVNLKVTFSDFEKRVCSAANFHFG